MLPMILQLWLLLVASRFALSSSVASPTGKTANFPTEQAPLTTAPPTPISHHHAARFWSTYSDTYGGASSNICGYLTFNPRKSHGLIRAHSNAILVAPLACYQNEFCTSDGSTGAAYQCCQSSSESANGPYVTFTLGSNCTQYGATACYPSTAAHLCDDACQSTAVVCNAPDYPECFTAVGDGEAYNQNLTAMWCDVVSSSLSVYPHWLWTWSTSLGADFTSTMSRGPLSQTPGSTVPFEKSQQTVGASAAGAQVTGTSRGVRLSSSGYGSLAIALLAFIVLNH